MALPMMGGVCRSVCCVVISNIIYSLVGDEEEVIQCNIGHWRGPLFCQCQYFAQLKATA